MIGIALSIACSGVTDPTPGLSLEIEHATLTLAVVRDAGLHATFVNRTATPVRVTSSGCSGLGSLVDRFLNGDWVAVPPAVQNYMCPLILVDNSVPPGGTLSTHAERFVPDTGRFRLRLATSAGEAISGAVEVR